MKQPLFIKNISIDEKRISFIEKVVSRLARRSIKVSSAIIAPYPISSCVSGEEVSGDILKYMFTSDGVIKKCGIHLNARPKAEIIIDVKIEGEEKGEARSFILTKKRLVADIEVHVKAFDRLTASMKVTDPEQDKISEVWISLLWIPSIKDTDVKSFLIDKLDKVDVLEE